MTETTAVPDSKTAAGALGVILRQAREQKGYSVGEVAERLKLPARQIEALESGEYQDLPEPVFVKGFLRSYARLVDVDATVVQECIASIYPTSGPDAQPPYNPEPFRQPGLDYRDSKVRKPVPKWVFGLVVLVTIGAAIYAWQNKSSAEYARQSESASQVNEGQVRMPNVDADNVSVVPMNGSDAASVPVAASATAVSASSAVGGQTLVVKVRYRSLLHVTNAQGEVLINQIVPALSEHRFDNGVPYQVKIGYASGSTLSLGGVDIPLQGHIRDKTASLTVGGGNE